MPPLTPRRVENPHSVVARLALTQFKVGETVQVSLKTLPVAWAGITYFQDSGLVAPGQRHLHPSWPSTARNPFQNGCWGNGCLCAPATVGSYYEDGRSRPDRPPELVYHETRTTTGQKLRLPVSPFQTEQAKWERAQLQGATVARWLEDRTGLGGAVNQSRTIVPLGQIGRTGGGTSWVVPYWPPA